MNMLMHCCHIGALARWEQAGYLTEVFVTGTVILCPQMCGMLIMDTL